MAQRWAELACLLGAVVTLSACSESTPAPSAGPMTAPVEETTPRNSEPATPSLAEVLEPRTRPRYVFPIQPAGVADYGATHHDYPATDIFAPEGSRFVAVTDGMVQEVSRRDRWDPSADDPATRGGLYVSVIGDDGIRYYGAHLRGAAPGVRAGVAVDAGQLLGWVGDSGNARGISPHLHFGISRPTFPGDWEVRRGQLNPYPYLQAWARGQPRRPKLPAGS